MNWLAEMLDEVIARNDRLDGDAVAELRRARERLAQEVGFFARNAATDMLRQAIEDAETLDQVGEVFGSMPAEFGFDEATLIILNEGGRYLSRRVLSSLSDEWWSDYHSLRLFENDPLISGILGQDHEVFLDELIPKHDCPMHYTKAAQARGIGVNGVIFKIAYPTGLVAAVILNTLRGPDHARAQFRKYRDDLQALAYATCDALIHFSGIGLAAMAPLSAEEIHFLRLVAISEDPARALSMDCRFGSAVVIQRQVIRKLGVRSIFQAVLVAARRGLLDAAIFHPDEVVTTRPRIAGWDILQTLPLTEGEESAEAALQAALPH